MKASLAIKIGDLETAFWAKAETIELSVGQELADFVDVMFPLDSQIFNVWFLNDTEAAKITRRIDQIEKALPPIHPAFLPHSEQPYRLMQWGFYRRADYRELVEKQWTQLLEYARTHYDVTDGGLLGVSLRLYEKDIDRWIAEREYLDRPTSREELASNQIELWKIVRRRCDEADDPQDQEAQDEIWRQSLIEHVQVLYGREMTETELEFDKKMWAQLQEDMRAGTLASESEAAAYLRDLFDRYPRKESH
jgi:hypothetical protein